MFLELVVKDIDGKAIWASGLTNELSVILDGLTGKPLETENAHTNQSKFQPHYQQITKGSQVQIYELYSLTSHLNTDTPAGAAGIPNWKLKVAAACAQVQSQEACQG